MIFKHSLSKAMFCTSMLCTAALGLSALQAQAQKRPSTVTVAVFTINDFHAGIVSDPRQGVPGAAYVVQTLDSLKQVYPYNVTVSAGDNFGGSFFYTATRPKTLMPQVFKDMGITLSTLGNHEFDEGQEALADKWQQTELIPRNWHIDYISANTRNAEGKIPPFAQPWKIMPVSVGEGRTIDVAFVGLITSNTPWQASAKRLKGLTFDGNYTSVLDSVAKLPGYDAVRRAPLRLILAHIGTQMKDGRPVWDDRDAANLRTLNRPDFHAFLSAHSHSRVVGMSETAHPMPLTQGLWHGIYISMLRCEIDTVTQQVVSVVPELVRVNPKAVLSPKAARLQAQIEEQYHTTLFRGMPLSKVLSYTATGVFHDRKSNALQTKMGSLVCESYAAAYRQAAQAADDALVIGVSHFGSIRSGFPAGKVTVLDVGEALPFANPLKCYRYTGAQLQALMEHGINVCTLGRIQTSGVNVEQDKRGRVKRLSLTLPSGKVVPIKPTTPLVIVADEYMVTGGDGYLPAQFPKSQEITLRVPTSTDAFISYLQTIPEIK